MSGGAGGSDATQGFATSPAASEGAEGARTREGNAVAPSIPQALAAASLRSRSRDAEAPATDSELVAGVLAGRAEPFSHLYESLFPRVYRFARRRLDDRTEAEKVTQEVFETLLEVLPRFEGNRSLRVWAFEITRNRVNRRLAAERIHVPSDAAKATKDSG